MTMITFVSLNTHHVQYNSNRSIVFRKMKYTELQKIVTDQQTCRGGQRKISFCINVLLLTCMVNILARSEIKIKVRGRHTEHLHHKSQSSCSRDIAFVTCLLQ